MAKSPVSQIVYKLKVDEMNPDGSALREIRRWLRQIDGKQGLDVDECIDGLATAVYAIVEHLIRLEFHDSIVGGKLTVLEAKVKKIEETLLNHTHTIPDPPPTQVVYKDSLGGSELE